MNQNVPAIASSSYATSTYNAADVGNAMAYKAAVGQLGGNNLGALQQGAAAQNAFNHLLKGNTMSARRLVQVVIVDPNTNISLEECMLYKGDEKLTDATDQELFFELDIKDLLEKHNEKRTKVVDKKVKDRTEYLEPAKIRDLKMVVVNVASF